MAEDRDTGRTLVVTDILHPGDYGTLARGFNAWVLCKECGQKCHLANYVVMQDGRVTPTFSCPQCHWQGNLLLEGYVPQEELPSVAMS